MDSADTIVFSKDQPAATISKRVSRGELVRLARGVYTTEVDRYPADVVRQHAFDIVGRMFPEAVITDRSARTGAPVDGVLYLAHPARARAMELPRLKVRARTGAGPLPGDVTYPGGLHLASRGRGLAENCLPTRTRGGEIRRTLAETELGDWIDYICQNDGPDRLAGYREVAEKLADQLGVDPERLAILKSLVGIALGTRPDADTRSRSLAARRAGRPVDQVRVRRFEELVQALQGTAPQSRPVDPARSKS